MSKLSDADITILNAARTILDERSRYSDDPGYGSGRVAAMAEVAEHLIFKYLNAANVVNGREMTYEQLYNAPEPKGEVTA